MYRIYEKGEGRKRAAIVVTNPTLDIVLLNDASDEDGVFIELNNSHNVNLILSSVYWDINNDLKQDLFYLKEKLCKLNNNKYVICVDSNCRAKSWFDSVTNVRGKILESFIAENCLIFHNEDDGSPTYHSVSGSSNIDLTLSPIQMSQYVFNWKNLLLEEESLSDHNYLRFDIALNHQSGNNNNEIYSHKKYNTKKADWNKFEIILKEEFIKKFSDSVNNDIATEELDCILKLEVERSSNIAYFSSKFIKSLGKTCNKSIPMIGKNMFRKRRVCWWNEHLSEKRKEIMKKRRRYQKVRKRQQDDSLVKDEYFKCKKEYSEMIYQAKLSSWKAYCNITDGQNPWNVVYKTAAGKIKNNLIISTIKKPDGTYTSDFKETIETVMTKFFPLDDSTTETAYHAEIRREIENIDTDDDLEFTIDEVKRTINKFAPNKTPGMDGITKEIFLHAFEKFPNFITQLYLEFLKRGYFPKEWKHSLVIMLVKPGRENSEDVGKYRPISLLSFMGKVLERLLIDRIMHYLRTNRLLSERQMGFTPQTSTTDAIMDMTKCIEENFKKRKKVALISMDVEGAFDAAWWPSILHQLKQFKCPKNLFNLTKSYFIDRKATLSLNDYQCSRLVSRGCPQGSCCGPGYWNIMYDSVLRLPFSPEVKVLAFADDLLLLISAQSTIELEAVANETLNLVHIWSKRNKIKFNPKKSKSLLFKRKGEMEELNIYLNAEKIEQVSEIKYLGVTLDTRYTFNQHVDNICQKSLQIINILSRSAKVYWGLGSEALRTIYIGAIEPILLYACPVWEKAVRKKFNQNKLKRVQRLMAIRIIKGFRTISYDASIVVAGIHPILLKLQESLNLYRVFRNLESDNYDKEISYTKWLHPGFDLDIDNHGVDKYKYEIFTDGSKTTEGVGCAVVVFHNGRVIENKKFKLSPNCSNNQAEQFAILKAISWTEENGRIEGNKNIVIKTDSELSIAAIKNRDIHWPLTEEIRHLLHKSSWKVKIEWVKAHVGNEGNELADKLAKEATVDENLEPSYTKYPKTYWKMTFRKEMEENWNEEWLGSTKGRETQRYIPTIGDRKRLDLRIDYKLTQILTGHGRTRYYLHRFHIIDEPYCPCDNTTIQNWDHLIDDCALLDRHRLELIRNILTTGHDWPPNRPLLLSSEIMPSFLKFISKIDIDIF